DHTSLACVPETARGEAVLVAKEAGVLAGVEVAETVYRLVDPHIDFKALKHDGDRLAVGDRVWTVSGASRSILTAERLSLNYVQRMSGIATQTRRLVDMLAGTRTTLLDTRKTTPNNRVFEKMAVRIGGGSNHRFGLFDMILIKDNHIDFAGGVVEAVQAAEAYLKANGLKLPVEVEVRNEAELEAVLRHGGVQRIMLDNFTVPDLKKAVEKIGGRYETEASGGITEATLKDYASSGVDFISVGGLTHHVASLDLSLKAVHHI
ncbi:MAG: carboxylating nicotinate-nucleotide diphosphorylase, partial [Bacteroidales bacterium]|nr:carboxylating nicotinate-nucleotide diphosphorylase [Bacteroidales bacterium]